MQSDGLKVRTDTYPVRVPRFPGSPTSWRHIAAVAIFVALLAFVSGCGSTDETFSNSEADNALAALDAIQEYVDEGRCERASRRVNALAAQSTRINNDRPQLGEAYASSVARLQTLVTRECVEIMPTSPTPAVTESTGETGGPDVPPTSDTGGGTVPDNGGDTGGDTPGNNGGDQGGGNAPDNGGSDSPPADSGGAGPGT